MKQQTAATGRNSSSIPSPSAVPKISPKRHQQLVLESTIFLCETLSEMNTDMTVRLLRDTTREALSNFSASTVASIKTCSWTPGAALMFCNGIDEGWSETKAKDCIALSTALDLHDNMSFSEQHLNAYEGNTYPELFPLDNDAEYPEERFSQITALYHVTEHMLDIGDEHVNPYSRLRSDNMYYISDPALQSLILTPGKYSRDEIVNVIRDHGTFDTERIKRLLDFDTKSMRDGVL
jgi:hypothetical protein